MEFICQGIDSGSHNGQGGPLEAYLVVSSIAERMVEKVGEDGVFGQMREFSYVMVQVLKGVRGEMDVQKPQDESQKMFGMGGGEFRGRKHEDQGSPSQCGEPPDQSAS